MEKSSWDGAAEKTSPKNWGFIFVPCRLCWEQVLGGEGEGKAKEEVICTKPQTGK